MGPGPWALLVCWFPEALLERSGGHLGSKSQHDLQKSAPRANKSSKSQFAGPPWTPKLDAKIKQQ